MANQSVWRRFGSIILISVRHDHQGDGDVVGPEASDLLVSVKFFGPGRINGKLWGYASPLHPSKNGRDLRVTEPSFSDRRIPEGTVGLCTSSASEKGLRLSDFEVWSASPSQLAVLMRTIHAWETAGKTPHDALVRLVNQLDAHLVQGSLRPYRTINQIARAAELSFSSLSGELEDCIKDGSGLEWFSKIKRLPITSESEFEYVRGLLVDHIQITAVADQLLNSLSELGIDVMSTSLFPGLPAETQFRYLLNRVATFGWNEEVAHGISVRIKTLLPEVEVDEFRFLLRQMPSEFLLDFPELLAAEPSLATSLAAIALKTSSKNDPRSTPFINHLELRMSDLRHFSDTKDYATAAQMQAEIILGFHPSLSRRLQEKGFLAPELDHLVYCVRQGSCLSPNDYISIVGHAIADKVLASEGRHRFDSGYWVTRLSTLTSAPLGKEPETIVLALQDIVLGFLSQGDLRDHAGALTRLLPSCSPAEAPFCEGKPPSQEFTIPFCPRTKKGCEKAIVGPVPGREFEEFSLLDVIGSSVTQASFSLSGKTLINTIAGWVNRLIEVEDRLICETCRSRMIVDPEYSKKFTARYAATLFKCPNDCDGMKVYLSHCFNCHSVIDSRESRFSYNNFTGEVVGPGKPRQAIPGEVKYLCIHCANDFKPVCPNCGQGSQEGTAEEVRTCKSCGHRVERSRRFTLPRLGPISSTSTNAVTTGFTEHEAWGREPGIKALRRIAEGRFGWF